MGIAASFIQDLRVSRAPALGFMSVGLFWGSFAALVPDLKAAIGASDGQFGGAMFIASFGAVAAMWLAPRVDAKLGARAMQGAALAMALAFLLPGLAGGLMFFAGAMLLASAGSGTMDVIMNTRVSRIEAEEGRSLMNLNHGMFSFAYAGAALVTGLLREAGTPPVVVFAMMCGATLVMLRHMRSKGSPQAPGGLFEMSGQRAVVIFGGLIILISFLSEVATEAWSALLLERELGGSPAQGAFGPMILGLTMGVGRVSGQVFLGRFSETRLVQIAALVAATGLFIVSQASDLNIAYLGFGIFGLGVSITAPLAYSAIGKRVREDRRAMMITQVSVIGYLGFFVGPPLMGGLSELFGLRVSFMAVAGILLLVTAILAPALRRQPGARGG